MFCYLSQMKVSIRFLNEEDNDLIDFSLKNKILLCSPMTLYAFLSLIRQAISNFAIEKKSWPNSKICWGF